MLVPTTDLTVGFVNKMNPIQQSDLLSYKEQLICTHH